jgi:cysteine-S-conjugate beta-lyase
VEIPNPLTVLTLDQLRARRSIKWHQYDPDVLPMWIAETDTLLAPPIAAALSDAVARGDTGYVHPGGYAEAFAEFSARRLGYAPDPGHARVLPDVMIAIIEVLEVITGPGAGVVVNPPVYHPFFAFLNRSGRKVVPVPLVGDDYALDLAGLEAAFASGDVSAYLLCNPHNPTGIVYDRATLLEVATLATRHGVRLLVDEIHAPLVYPGVEYTPFLSLDHEAVERAFVFGSASKAWNLPGLKAALAFAGPDAVDELDRVPVEAGFGTGLLGVIAGEAALREGGPWLDALRTGLDANRTLLAELLADALPRVRYRVPDATYLAWLDCRALDLGDDPAEVFLERGRVALASGPPFGAEQGRGFARLNFATSPDLLREGVRRLAASV